MALETVRAVAQPPSSPVETGSPEQWAEVERTLGTALPEDYKALVDAYGTGGFNDFLFVFNPFTRNKYLNLLELRPVILQAYTELRNQFPESHPYPAHPEPGGLLPWARTENGDELYWLTDGEPNSWPVVFYETRHGSHQQFDAPATEVVAGLLRGELAADIFPPAEEFGDDGPFFVSHG